MINLFKRLKIIEHDLKTIDETISKLIEKHNSTYLVLKNLLEKLGYEEYYPLKEAVNEAQRLDSIEVRKKTKRKR